MKFPMLWCLSTACLAMASAGTVEAKLATPDYFVEFAIIAAI